MRSSVVRRVSVPAQLPVRRPLVEVGHRARLREVSAPAPAAPKALPKPPIRLRFVLLLALLGGAVAWTEPRARAAWKVHGLASALADYGVCMVGPTGPGLLRAKQMDEFRRLVRRRLVATGASDAPFERCAPLARKLTDSAASETAHRSRALSFAEYGGEPKPSHRVADLSVGAEALAEQARKAWPFVRGYAALVKPSLGAREAAHPAPTPEPAVGRGLPAARAYYRATKLDKEGVLLAHGSGANLAAFRSNDGGSTWKRVPASAAEEIAERCLAGTRGHAFSVSHAERSATLVTSSGPDREPHVERLATPEESVLAVACDEHALVAAVRAEESRKTELRRCDFAGPCVPMAGPKLGRTELGLEYPLDLARAGGTTVVAVTMDHVVRVASARDGGTFTPFTVAYDGGEHPLSRDAMPTKLLVVGKRVILHGSAERPNDGYGLLYSDDQGASFRGR